jgi:hypothetical protein
MIEDDRRHCPAHGRYAGVECWACVRQETRNKERCRRNDPPSLYDVMMTDEKSLCNCMACSFREHMLKPNADPCTDHPNND